jgi:PAS domain S-box-containing protein
MIDRGYAVGEAPSSRATILEAQLDASVEGSLVVSTDGRVLSWNGRFLEIWDLDEDVLATGTDAAVQEALEPFLSDSRRYRDRLAYLAAHPDERSRDEIRLRSGRVLDRHTAPLTVEGGQIAGRIFFFRDVTEEKRGEEGNRLLADAADLLSAYPGDEALPQRIASLVVPRFADWAAVDLLGRDEVFHRLGTAHVDPAKESLLRDLDRRYPVQAGQGHLRGRVVATGRPVILEGADAAAIRRVARDAEHAELLLALGISSAIWVPLIGRTETLGVMSFGLTTDRRTFRPEGLALAEELARRCALVIDNARIYERLRRREQQQGVVTALGLRALGGADLDDLFDQAVRMLAETLDVEFANILERLPDKRRLRLRAGVGWRAGLVGKATLGTDRGSQAGYTLRSGSPVVVTDLATEKRFSGAPLLLDHRVISGMSVIVQGHTGHWGVLGAHTARRRTFSEDDIHFLQAIANVLGDAIERQRGEDAIRERDDRLELTLAASRTGFWEWDVPAGKLEWSSQVSAIHGLPAGTAPAGFEEYVNDMIHPADRDLFRSTVTAAAESGGQYDLEFRIVWPDGSVHWTTGVGRAFVDASGRPVRMIGIGQDITERKRAEAEREESIERDRAASEIREAFIGVLSHELRTPITTIYGGVKVLRRRGDSLDPGSRAAVLDDIDAEADRLFRLVEDLLVLTRAERGNLEVGDEPVHLPPIINRVLGSARTMWPGIEFECEWTGRMPVVRGDDTYVEQVLRNLVGNAGKYSAPATMVEVETEIVAGEVEVRILDRGSGIDGASAERLFDLFYRASATARQASGAGIGLFVARRLVEAMNGRVWARPRPGGGSEFGFSLQLYDDR